MRIILAPIALMLIAVGGCASRGPILSPTARVAAVRTVEESQEGTRVEITVVLDNPNAVPLPLTRSDFTVNVAGGGTYSATDHPARTLPASGHQDFVIPAVIASSHSLKGAGYSIQGSVTYEPPGAIRMIMTQSKVPLPTADFAAAGKLQ